MTGRLARRLGVAVGGMALVVAAAAPVRGQLRGSGPEPVVTDLALYAAVERERSRDLDPRREIEIAPRQSVRIEAEPRDQYGRRFPLDRFRMGAELARTCDGVLSVTERDTGELEFEAGRQRGRCRALVWVAGNLNLEFELRFVVGGLGTQRYTRRQAEEIAARLYRAILQREIDAGSRAGTVAEIQRGRVESQVRAMTDSAEFAALANDQPPPRLLEAFYDGLLGRSPDSAGARDYLPQLAGRRYVAAVMNLIQSNEFEQAIIDIR